MQKLPVAIPTHKLPDKMIPRWEVAAAKLTPKVPRSRFEKHFQIVPGVNFTGSLPCPIKSPIQKAAKSAA